MEKLQSRGQEKDFKQLPLITGILSVCFYVTGISRCSALAKFKLAKHIFT
jgi:hypothetical protein